MCYVDVDNDVDEVGELNPDACSAIVDEVGELNPDE
mgnify:CR=1 FL=1